MYQPADGRTVGEYRHYCEGNSEDGNRFKDGKISARPVDLIISSDKMACDPAGKGRDRYQDHPFRPLHQPILAFNAQPFRSCPGVADHQAPDHPDKGEEGAEKIVMGYQVITDAKEEDRFAIPVQYG